MGTAEGYIARQIARTSGLVLSIIAAALVLERTLRLLRDVDPAALPVQLAAAILLCKIPEILGIAVPFSFFAGVLLTFQRLIRDRELDALQAAGAGPASFVRPLVVLTAWVAVLLLVVLWFLQPLGRYEVRVLMHDIALAALSAPLRTGAFLEFDGKVLHIQPRADRANLFLYDTDDEGRRFVTTAAAEGLMLSGNRQYLFMAAHDGRRVSIPHGDGKSTLLTARSLRIVVNAAHGPATAADRGGASELTLPELLLADPAPPVVSEIHTKLARVLATLMLPLAALSLALGFSMARQWIAIAVGAVLVLAMDQALLFGEISTTNGTASPWTAIWGAWCTFAAITGLMAVAVGLRFSRGRANQR